MSIAEQIVGALLDEAEPDDAMMKELSHVAITAGFKWMRPGESVSHGTGRAEDIIDACLAWLAEHDRPSWYRIRSEHEKEFAALRRVAGGGANTHDFEDSGRLAHEILPDEMQKHCPPFTYFGSSEGDGTDIGCWPNILGLEEEADYGEKVTRLEAETQEAADFKKGTYSVRTPFVWIHADYGDDSLWDAARHKLLWSV